MSVYIVFALSFVGRASAIRDEIDVTLLADVKGLPPEFLKWSSGRLKIDATKTGQGEVNERRKVFFAWKNWLADHPRPCDLSGYVVHEQPPFGTAKVWHPGYDWLYAAKRCAISITARCNATNGVFDESTPPWENDVGVIDFNPGRACITDAEMEDFFKKNRQRFLELAMNATINQSIIEDQDLIIQAFMNAETVNIVGVAPGQHDEPYALIKGSRSNFYGWVPESRLRKVSSIWPWTPKLIEPIKLKMMYEKLKVMSRQAQEKMTEAELKGTNGKIVILNMNLNLNS